MLNRAWVVWCLVALQCLCGTYFLWEILASILGLPAVPLRWNVRELVEAGTSLGLILGAFFGVRLAIMARKAAHRAETAQQITAGEFAVVVDRHLTQLGLTSAETEIAWFVVKGMSHSEIAALRRTRVGTVKVI